MDVSSLRNYGAAFSDSEGSWPPEVKARMRKGGMRVVRQSLSWGELPRFAWAFLGKRRKAASLDLSDIRARGMTNEGFLRQQLEYLALFAALAEVCGTERAIATCKAIMDETAREPLLLCLPEPEKVRALGDPWVVFGDYFAPAPEAARKAGCQDLRLVREGDALGFDIKWCVWLELARKMGVPEACLPNCYSDDLVFPEYFAALGIRHRRTGTLAEGRSCCDFRFERIG